MKIVKIIQWDMGHRVLNHRSICKGLHGHRYKAEICLEGELINESGESEEGMVIDFADIKKTAQKFIQKELDHANNVDIQSLKSSDNSLKDEWLVIVFSLIFLAHYILL